MTKPILKTLLTSNPDTKLLFLGREGLFTAQEIKRFLKSYHITPVTEYEAGIVGLVEHHSLNPVEEDISCMAYDDGVPLYKLADFEKLLSGEINDAELLMGLKLSNDQERVFRLLGNSMLSDTLFVKLLNLYEWDETDEDSREDRDVIMFTLRRYITIRPNEEDLLQSYLTLRRLAREATDSQLLMALTRFPNFDFLVRGKPKVTLRETIARNMSIDKEITATLIGFRDARVDVALAGNAAVASETLKMFVSKEREVLDEALASNRNIDETIFEILLGRGERVQQLLLLWQPIDVKCLVKIEAAGLSDEIFATIGANEQLIWEVLEHLLAKEEKALLCHLSANTIVSTKQLNGIYKRGIDECDELLAGNPNISKEVMAALYEKSADNMPLLKALAANPHLPETMLRALFERKDLEINKALATNASLPMELLDILKVDTRLQNELAQNSVFIEAYESVFEFDAKAISK